MAAADGNDTWADALDTAATAVELTTWLAVLHGLLNEYPEAPAALAQHLDHLPTSTRRHLTEAARTLARALDHVVQDTQRAPSSSPHCRQCREAAGAGSQE